MGKEKNVFSIRWWLQDPNTGYMSWRKARMGLWLAMTPFIVMGTIHGSVGWPEALTLLGMGGFDGAMYAAKTPSKDVGTKAE